MTALAPVEAGYGGRTTSAQPTFWFYMPYDLNEDSPVTLSIQDESGNELYQTTFTATTAAGIYGIGLPDSVELAVDHYYDWYVMVYCNDPLRQNVPNFASGWVQRVSPPGAIDLTEMQTLSPTEQSRIFADELLWYDALNPLAEAHQANSPDTDVEAEWKELLELPSVNLSEFVEMPMRPCCQIQD